ncbi:MAG: hypothetical protein ACRDZ7_02690, partial [Acidimicrobiia bacterium]
DTVAHALNAEFGTAFVGRADHNVDLILPVDRRRQLGAIHHHASQSTDNPVLWRRLHLQGDVEWMRWLRVDGIVPSRDPRREHPRSFSPALDELP